MNDDQYLRALVEILGPSPDREPIVVRGGAEDLDRALTDVRDSHRATLEKIVATQRATIDALRQTVGSSEGIVAVLQGQLASANERIAQMTTLLERLQAVHSCATDTSSERAA